MMSPLPRLQSTRFRRLLLTGLTALTLASLSQADADTIAVTGSLSVTFTALGKGHVTSLPALGYSTAGPVMTPGATRRAVTVRLVDPLPPGVMVVVHFSPDVGRGTSSGPVTLMTEPQLLIDLIGADVVQNAKPLTYTVSTTQGFTDLSLNIEFELVDL